ncbi:toll/interleukin-1 receptor domain-containing protein [Rhizobacter sp. AJA081-3]|uniref:toll/interleukin-1 receptor domain-containing protein n=1 Tax=Rhizobacter sp. AJA081-3 TaxID=2753607 RepID=UPI001AE091FB|nr:toll/interleukin-1 receptor domain-containing protein [Rhizobacter sp. AJA081-3]QTN21848.1 toll/interleukin-1 receptor domain-containing protein [Rhizobacter sp. AJA081-3]
MGAIFISYRRDDTEGHAGRLYEDLVERFGRQAVFFDVSAIEPGQDFRKAIDANVARCSVLLAMIGPRWLDASAGARRIDDAGDFVRLEIASALKRDVPVVPVLVQGAKMPAAAQLPADVADLAWRNAVELSHARWPSDVQVLAQALAVHMGGAEAAPPRQQAPGSASTRPQEPVHSSPRWKLWVLLAALLPVVAAAGWYFTRPDPTLPPPPVDRARIAALVAQMNDNDMAPRKSATAKMLAEHRRSALAVELAVDQLSEASFQRLSKEGRVNVLTFLVESELSAWTPAQRGEARASLARIRGRIAAGQAALGPQILELLGQLEERLSR